MFKRIFLLVLDSFGIGELPDAKLYGDEGSNTLRAVQSTGLLNVPTMTRLGLYNIDNVKGDKSNTPIGSFGRFAEKSKGKDTTTGHWEIAGIVLDKPFPVFLNGFPKEIIDKLAKSWGVSGVLCNQAYSGTDVIRDFGKEHIKTKQPIIYTSQDSVLQIACHEEVFSLEELYDFCQKARGIMQGEYAVGRVIARPFIGEDIFTRTIYRKDYSLPLPQKSLLDYLKYSGKDVISIGKIFDVFNGQGITQVIAGKNNEATQKGLNSVVDIDFEGLCFANFVDFDTLYGHRNDAKGYALAINSFDNFLNEFIDKLKEDDLLLVTADHGCDPITPSTDHSREYIPLLVYGKKVLSGVNLGTRETFADIGATIAQNFNIKLQNGTSFLNKITKQ